MRKRTKEPAEVKCADCGFLSVMSRADGSYIEANRFYRLEGFQGMSKDTVFIEPHCSIHYQSIHAEPLIVDGVGGFQLTDPGGGIVTFLDGQGKDVAGEAVLPIITKLRVCDGFYLWKPGFTPKEHYEMLDRERWEKWQTEQRHQDKLWRIIELVVMVLAAGLFTLLGAFIGRGLIFPPHP